MSERSEIESLLPWYVTGKLSVSEHEMVEQYLNNHPDMAMQIELIKQERLETTLINETITTPSTSNVERFMEKMGDEFGVSKGHAHSSWLHSLWSQVRNAFHIPVVQFASVAAAVLIIFQAIALGVVLKTGPQSGSYTTASGPSNTPAKAVVLLVTLNQSATSGEISKFLGESKGVIVNGPLAEGFYHIKFASKTNNSNEVEKFTNALIKALENRKDLFVFVSEFE